MRIALLVLLAIVICFLILLIIYRYRSNSPTQYLIPILPGKKTTLIEGQYGVETHLIEPSFANPIRYPDFLIQDVSQAPLTRRVPRDFRITSPDGKIEYSLSYENPDSLDSAKDDYCPPRYFTINGIKYQLEFLNTKEGVHLPDDVLLVKPIQD